MLQWEVVFVPPARIKRTAHDGQGHMCEIKSSGCNICPRRVFSADLELDLQMTTRKHLLKVTLCTPGSPSQLPALRECSCLRTGPAEPHAGSWGQGWGWGGCLGVEPAGGPCLGLKASGLLGLRSGNACVCPVRGGRGREGTSFPLGTPLPIHRLLADTHTAAWVVCKVGIYDKEAGEGWKWAFTGVFHGDLASV